MSYLFRSSTTAVAAALLLSAAAAEKKAAFYASLMGFTLPDAVNPKQVSGGGQ
jgi:hypothetical protein